MSPARIISASTTYHLVVFRARRLLAAVAAGALALRENRHESNWTRQLVEESPRFRGWPRRQAAAHPAESMNAFGNDLQSAATVIENHDRSRHEKEHVGNAQIVTSAAAATRSARTTGRSHIRDNRPHRHRNPEDFRRRNAIGPHDLLQLFERIACGFKAPDSDHSESQSRSCFAPRS